MGIWRAGRTGKLQAENAVEQYHTLKTGSTACFEVPTLAIPGEVDWAFA